MHVHPQIVRTMVARQVSETNAAAASARRAREARVERAAASAVLASGTPTAADERSARRQWLLGRRWMQGQSQPA